MTLKDLGFHDFFISEMPEKDSDKFSLARVVVSHRDNYIIRDTNFTYSAEITGKIRFSARSAADFPVTGDWVSFTPLDNKQAIIHRVLPRKTRLCRRSDNKKTDIQLIAANIDTAFIVQGADRDYNLNRLERYKTIASTGNIRPVVVLNKIDLLTPEEHETRLLELRERFSDTLVVSTSNLKLQGTVALTSLIEKGNTYCFIGSSGAGKSTLINSLAGEELLLTRDLSDKTRKGRHTTSHKELFILPGGGIVIDTPGMREVGITDSGEGLKETFRIIYDLAEQCRFNDCNHENEPGCAVKEAIGSGKLNRKKYENYLKMKREAEYFELSLKERRDRDRQFGKLVKEVMKNKKHK